MNLERSYVLNVGSISIDKGPFQERGFTVHQVAPGEVIAVANYARLIVIAEPAGKIGLIREYLEILKPISDDYGLAFAFLVSARELNTIEGLVAELSINHK